MNRTIMSIEVQDNGDKDATKLATRKDVRDRLTEEEARIMFMNHHAPYLSEKDIEEEIRKIYDSSSESSLGVPLFNGGRIFIL